MKQDWEENIDRYLQGLMNPDEKSAFEKKIGGDEMLTKQVQIHGLLLKNIQMIGRKRDEEIFALLKQCDERTVKNSFHRKEHPILRKLVKWGITTIIIFALIFGFKHFFMQRAEETLYNKYYETYRDGILYIGSHNIEDFNKAMIYWQEGKDDSAIYKLTKIIENGKYHPKYEEACWYLSLFYLKTKQNTEAIEMLEKIVTDKGYYADKATKIIEELENSIQ